MCITTDNARPLGYASVMKLYSAYVLGLRYYMPVYAGGDHALVEVSVQPAIRTCPKTAEVFLI